MGRNGQTIDEHPMPRSTFTAIKERNPGSRADIGLQAVTAH